MNLPTTNSNSYYSLKAHGAPFVVQVGHDKITTGKSAAAIFSHKVTNVKSINFVSCFSANGGAFSNAQMLSNTMNIPVKGYYGKINLHNASIAGEHSKVFHPQKGLKAQFCGGVNQNVGKVVKTAITAFNTIKKRDHDN